MSAPGTPKCDAAAAACRNAQHELYEIAERLSQLRNELPSRDDRWLMLDAEMAVKSAASVCQKAADKLYKEE